MDGANTHRAGGTFRLLPWTGAGGKPAYVLGDGTGYVSRLADNIESVQLGMAGDLLDHATALLADQRVTGAEFRFLANRLSESLRDVKRVAESRGARLDARCVGDDDDDSDTLDGEVIESTEVFEADAAAGGDPV
ncbi:hypothetical protein ABZ401_04355 [Streptomyces sp. NPDC005892]|uniref:hypothetical protein n=1 Tax=Streptomyces sp. NPDC005892 TaxID=3155593 RepID=UPI0033C2B0E7